MFLLTGRSAGAASADRIVPPRATRTFDSANSSYRLTVRAVDRTWRSDAVIGRLNRVEHGAPARVLWERRLPQAYGPRFAVVGSLGDVLLVDEWINTPSPRALQLLDRRGVIRNQWSFRDLAAVLGISGQTLSQAAGVGTWVGAEPRLDDMGTRVLIGAGGKTLVVELATGALEVRP